MDDMMNGHQDSTPSRRVRERGEWLGGGHAMATAAMRLPLALGSLRDDDGRPELPVATPLKAIDRGPEHGVRATRTRCGGVSDVLCMGVVSATATWDFA